MISPLLEGQLCVSSVKKALFTLRLTSSAAHIQVLCSSQLTHAAYKFSVQIIQALTAYGLCTLQAQTELLWI